MKYIGIDIGGTKCAVVLGNKNGEIENKIRFDTTNFEDTLKNIIDAVGKIGKGDAIGISCGGPLDSKKGIIMSPPNLPGWDDVRICEILKGKFSVPVFLQNDADACALAEWKFGAGKGTENMIFLTFGTGLGSGLILNGRLYSGTSGMAGEAGHIALEDDGPVGYGKAGSFEGFCSGGGIAKMGMTKALEMFESGKVPSFCKSKEDVNQINARVIAECANKGFDDAKEIFDKCATMLGKGLSILIDILNPEKIVIGSIFARCENLLRDKMEEEIKKQALIQSLKDCSIVPALLGERIGDIAAITVAVNGLEQRRG